MSPAGGVGSAPGEPEGPGVADGPGVGVGVGFGLGDGPGAPVYFASSRLSASCSVEPQTMLRGEATTIRSNEGNFALCDWR